MAEGFSLHLGVNSNDPFKLGFRAFATLKGCDLAARAMDHIASDRGYGQRTVLIDEHATRSALEQWLTTAANQAAGGDIVFISFAGHGTLLRGIGKDEINDQGIVLHDGKYRDDDFYAALAGFRAGVRIVIVCDACYSGSIFMISMGLADRSPRLFGLLDGVLGGLTRERHDGFPKRALLPANVLLLAATTDVTMTFGSRSPAELPPFTKALVAAYTAKAGNFSGGYDELFQDIGGDAVLNRDLVNDPTFVALQPFAV